MIFKRRFSIIPIRMFLPILIVSAIVIAFTSHVKTVQASPAAAVTTKTKEILPASESTIRSEDILDYSIFSTEKQQHLIINSINETTKKKKIESTNNNDIDLFGNTTTTIKKMAGNNNYKTNNNNNNNNKTKFCRFRTPRGELRSFPSFGSMNGGIVFFVHIPKVGGTTVRFNFQRFHNIDYRFGKNCTIYNKTIVPFVENAIINGTKNGTILFAEVHAKDSPSLLRLRKRIKRWKDIAYQNNIPFFTFTLVRESLSHSISHFNFFHVQKRNPTFERCNATEENFLRLTLHNPQCQFLADGERSMRAQKVKNTSGVTSHTCQLVYETILDTMDWVGTTERLSNETLVLLSKLLHLPDDINFKNHRVTNNNNKDTNLTLLRHEKLTSSAINTVLQMASLDIELYAKILQDFNYNMWRDCL